MLLDAVDTRIVTNSCAIRGARDLMQDVEVRNNISTVVKYSSIMILN